MSSTLFINAKVWNPDGTFSGSFGIRDNYFDFSGSASEANKLKNNYEHVTDLRGKLVLPGLTDGHVHLCYGSLMRKRIDCTGVDTIGSLRQKIEEHIKYNPEKQWLVGGNLDIGKLGLGLKDGNPLDEIVSGRPVFIANYDFHSALVNSRAADASGLLNRLSDFSTDEVPRSSGHGIDGIIREKAFKYVFSNIPAPTLRDRADAVGETIGLLHSYGITGVSDITLPDDLQVYIELSGQGNLRLRVSSYLPFEVFKNRQDLIEKASGIDKSVFSIKGFKAYYDGALGSGTALFKQNYKGKDFSGYATEAALSGSILAIAGEIDRAGMQCMVHAIGDRAVSEVLGICEKLNAAAPGKDRRFRIEHAQHIDEADFGRFRETGAVVSVQPIHLRLDAGIVKDKLPAGLLKSTHNYKNLMERGIVVNFGSDFPVAGLNPFENIGAALTRKINGEEFFPENRISLHECLRAYTINNSFASFRETSGGSVSKGKYADFAVMQDDLFELDKDEISNAKVWRTYFNGIMNYEL